MSAMLYSGAPIRRSEIGCELIFNAQFFTFAIARADNGLIFEEYDPNADRMVRKLAMTPDQLKALFDEWHAERSGKLMEFAETFLITGQTLKI